MDRYATLRDGLIGAWCPALGDSGYLLRDRSGRNRNATLTGMGGQVAYQAGPRGVALVTDGQNDYAGTTVASGLSSGFSFACWTSVKTATPLGLSGCVTSEVASFSNFWALLGVFQQKMTFSIFDGTRNPIAQAATNITVNQWYHIVGVRRPSAGRIYVYVNGVEAASAIDNTTTVPGYSALNIGGQTNTAGRYLDGQISDARVWSRDLTVAEINALYVGGPGVGLLTTRHRRAKVLGSQFWLNVSGTWKKATPFIKVAGEWEQATPKLNVSGTWK